MFGAFIVTALARKRGVTTAKPQKEGETEKKEEACASSFFFSNSSHSRCHSTSNARANKTAASARVIMSSGQYLSGDVEQPTMSPALKAASIDKNAQ